MRKSTLVHLWPTRVCQDWGSKWIEISTTNAQYQRKPRYQTQSYMIKAPTPTEMSKRQSKKCNQNFNYTANADRLRTASWSNDSHYKRKGKKSYQCTLPEKWVEIWLKYMIKVPIHQQKCQKRQSDNAKTPPKSYFFALQSYGAAFLGLISRYGCEIILFLDTKFQSAKWDSVCWYDTFLILKRITETNIIPFHFITMINYQYKRIQIIDCRHALSTVYAFHRLWWFYNY